MLAGEYCSRDVAIVGKTDSIIKAAKLMREYHVGSVVVVDARNGERVPVGILTDSDIVIGIIAQDADIHQMLIEDVVSFQLVTVNEDDDLMTTIKRMRLNGVRRIPVVNKAGGLVGVLAIDDILDIITEQMMDIDQLIARQQSREKELRL